MNLNLCTSRWGVQRGDKLAMSTSFTAPSDRNSLTSALRLSLSLCFIRPKIGRDGVSVRHLSMEKKLFLKKLFHPAEISIKSKEGGGVCKSNGGKKEGVRDSIGRQAMIKVNGGKTIK